MTSASELLGRAFAPQGPGAMAVLAILGIAVLVSALAVVTRKSPVASIAWLVVHFIATACIYVVLDSQFLAAVQVLVYAGAIMVLFLFVVMLLSLDRLPDPGSASGGGRKLLVLALGLVLLTLFARLAGESALPGDGLAAEGATAAVEEDSAEWLAAALFSRHLVAFELSSIPLLAAMAGVLVYTTRRVLVRKGAKT